MREWIDASRFDAHGEKYPEVEGNRAQLREILVIRYAVTQEAKYPTPKTP